MNQNGLLQKNYFKITRFPDVTLAKYLGKYQGNVRGTIFDVQNGLLSLLWEINAIHPHAYTIRYLYNRPYLNCYLIIASDGKPENLPAIEEIIRNSPVTEFYEFKRLDENELGDDFNEQNWAKESILASKQEAFLEPLRKDRAGLPEKFYVTYPLEPDPANDYLFLDQLLNHMDAGRVVFDIGVKPTKLMISEKDALKKWILTLEQVNSYKSEAEHLQEKRDERERDLNAEAAKKIFEEYNSEYASNTIFEAFWRITTEKKDYARIIAGSIFTSITNGNRFSIDSLEIFGPGDYSRLPDILGAYTGGFPENIEACRYQKLWKAVYGMAQKGHEHFQTIQQLGRFPYLVQDEEVAPFFRFLVPSTNIPQAFDRESDSSLGKEEKDREERVRLGIDFERPRRVVYVNRQRLKKHLFISGVPGSGKTTVVLNVLLRLWKMGTPFLVIEPAKTEYRTMALFSQFKGDDTISRMYRKMAEDLRVFTIGRDQGIPFRFNPFEFPPGLSLDQHLANLDACFRGALPLENPMPALLAESIDYIYQSKGWHGEDTGDKKGSDGQPLPFPCMEDLYNAISFLLGKKNYSQEIKDNISTALEVRIGGLLKRNIGQIFNSPRCFPSFSELMKQPVILEMDALSEEQTNLMTMFILMSLREYVQGHFQTGDDLNHILVLEEAHNVVGSFSEGEDDANPKVHATRFVSRMLAEVRALGEGLIIADQIPTAVAPEVVKNTGIKLINRLVSEDDRETIGMAMVMDPIQKEDLARLSPGQGYLYMESLSKPVKMLGDDPRSIKTAEGEDITSIRPPTELELVDLLFGRNWFIRHARDLLEQSVITVKNFDNEYVNKIEDFTEKYEKNEQEYRQVNENIVRAVNDLRADAIHRLMKEAVENLNNLSSVRKDLETLIQWFDRQKDICIRNLNFLNRLHGRDSAELQDGLKKIDQPRDRIMKSLKQNSLDLKVRLDQCNKEYESRTEFKKVQMDTFNKEQDEKRYQESRKALQKESAKSDRTRIKVWCDLKAYVPALEQAVQKAADTFNANTTLLEKVKCEFQTHSLRKQRMANQDPVPEELLIEHANFFRNDPLAVIRRLKGDMVFLEYVIQTKRIPELDQLLEILTPFDDLDQARTISIKAKQHHRLLSALIKKCEKDFHPLVDELYREIRKSSKEVNLDAIDDKNFKHLLVSPRSVTQHISLIDGEENKLFTKFYAAISKKSQFLADLNTIQMSFNLRKENLKALMENLHSCKSEESRRMILRLVGKDKLAFSDIGFPEMIIRLKLEIQNTQYRLEADVEKRLLSIEPYIKMSQIAPNFADNRLEFLKRELARYIKWLSEDALVEIDQVHTQIRTELEQFGIPDVNLSVEEPLILEKLSKLRTFFQDKGFKIADQLRRVYEHIIKGLNQNGLQLNHYQQQQGSVSDMDKESIANVIKDQRHFIEEQNYTRQINTISYAILNASFKFKFFLTNEMKILRDHIRNPEYLSMIDKMILTSEEIPADWRDHYIGTIKDNYAKLVGLLEAMDG